jgi:hypothetical protein
VISFASFLGGGSDIVCIIFTEKGSQYTHSETISMNSLGIIHVTSLKIVDGPLTLIFMMRQRVCRVSFSRKCNPIVYLWRRGTMKLL